MNFDGAGDFPDHRFGVDESSSPSNERSMYDDRGPFFNSFGNGHGPPPPVPSYRSPYAETVRGPQGSTSRTHRTTYGTQELFPPAAIVNHSRPHSRYSEPISPGARRTNDLPPSGFQYGSGPIPRDGEPYNTHASHVGAVQPSVVDPMWLNNLLTTAVKQGVEESRRMDTQSEGQARYKETNLDAKSAPPGAWPESPLGTQAQPHQHREQPAFSSRDHQSEHGSNWAKSQPGWGERPPRSRAGTHVTWNAEPAFETDSSSVGAWNAQEDTPSDAWDTGDTWPTDKAAEWDASSQQGKLWVTNPPNHYHLRSSSPVTLPKHDRRRSKHETKRSSRSKSRSRRSHRDREITSSSDDNGSWDRLERPSDSVVSLSSSDATLQPSRSRSRVEPSRRRSKSRSRLSKSVQRDHERKPSKRSHRHPSSRPADDVPVAGPAPSVITRMTPTVMNAPPFVPPEQARSRQPSAYAGPSASVMPTLEWGAAVYETIRKPSNVPSNVFPAPYAPSMKESVQSTTGEKVGGGQSPSAVSWGSGKKDHTVKPSWVTETEKNTGWGKNSDSGWQENIIKENDKKGWYSTDDDQAGGWNEADGNKKTQVDDGGWNTKQTRWDNPPFSPKQERVDKLNDWAGLKSALTSAFANPSAPAPAPEVPWRNQTWNFPADNAVQPAIQQPAITPFTSAPVPPVPVPDRVHPPNRRMSNKTLSRYRPNHNFPFRIIPKPTPDFTAQPHWQFPPPPSTPTPKNVLHADDPNDTYVAPAEPRLTISKSTSSKNGIEHAVRAGKATEYGHVVGRPEYLDRLEKPYAVFRFKYRSEGVLKGLGVLGEGDMKYFEQEKKDKQEADKLKGIPQEELIEKMLALERKLEVIDNGEGTTGDGKERKHSKKSIDKEKQKSKQRRSSEKTDAHGDGLVKDFTEQWVERHSRDPSVKAKSAVAKEVGWEGDKERKEKEVVGTWGQDANEGWGGGGMTW